MRVILAHRFGAEEHIGWLFGGCRQLFEALAIHILHYLLSKSLGKCSQDTFVSADVSSLTKVEPLTTVNTHWCQGVFPVLRKLKDFKDLIGKARPESGLDCLICAIFARQRLETCSGSEEGSYWRSMDFCITLGLKVMKTREENSVELSSFAGLRPSHQKSTCLTQSTLGHYVVQSWSRNV